MTSSYIWVDYLIFVIVLLLSLAVGIFFSIMERRRVNRQKKIVGTGETKEFLLGGRQMHGIPVACSLLATFMSAITLLGTPDDIYRNGIMYSFMVIGFSIQIAICCIFFIPLFYNLNITSSYQYLGLRFNKACELIGVTSFAVQMIPFLGIFLYAPSLALSIIIDIHIWIPIASLAVICTIYTTIGGIKAVVWTDVLQLAMMAGGLVAVIIKGSITFGGMGKVWDRLVEHNRVSVSFDPDPRVLYTFWSTCFGNIFLWLSLYGINQSMVQRVLSVKTVFHARLSYIVAAIMMCIMIGLTVLCGFLLFYDYYGCDPLTSKQITKADQNLPLFVKKYITEHPGVTGIFIAGIFSGSLSSVSSALNSLSGVTLNLVMVCKPQLSDRKAVILSKVFVILYGFTCLIFAWISSLTAAVLQIALMLTGVLGGPLLGKFILGMFFPFTNSIGAIVGFSLSQIFIIWVAVGSFVTQIKRPTLPIYNFKCVNQTVSYFNETRILAKGHPISGLENLYALSVYWYPLAAIIIVLAIGIPVSLCTKSHTKLPLNENLITPCLRKCYAKYLEKGDPHILYAFRDDILEVTENDGKLEMTKF